MQFKFWVSRTYINTYVCLSKHNRFNLLWLRSFWEFGKSYRFCCHKKLCLNQVLLKMSGVPTSLSVPWSPDLKKWNSSAKWASPCNLTLTKGTCCLGGSLIIFLLSYKCHLFPGDSWTHILSPHPSPELQKYFSTFFLGIFPWLANEHMFTAEFNTYSLDPCLPHSLGKCHFLLLSIC